MEWLLLTQTIRAGQKSGVIDEDSVKRVAVDTTVMEKNIAYPTDARLYERARDQLVELAQEAGVDLRQSYARLAPRLALQVGRYAHAKQMGWMPAIFDILRNQAPGAGGEIQLADAINTQAAAGLVHAVRLSGQRFDCGSVPGFLATILHVARSGGLL